MTLATFSEAQLARLPSETRAFLRWQLEWTSTARPNQIPPDVDPATGEPWLEYGAMSGRGWGKLLSVDTPVPTPSGWKRNGDLQDGDLVFDERGGVCRIVQAHEPMVPERMYRVRFADGSAIDAGGEHLWMTLTHRARKQMLRHGVETIPSDWPFYRHPLRKGMGSVGAEVLSTEDIAATLTHSTRKDFNHCIPLTQALELPTTHLEIPPYLLGIWLGDGSSATAELTCAFEDFPHYDAAIRELGYIFHPPHNIQPRSATFTISKGHGRRRCEETGVMLRTDSLHTRLREMGLHKNKHVPSEYLRASKEQRLALLQGLMDTDGTIRDGNNQCCFDNTKKVLADAVYELVVSLGMKASRTVKRAKLSGVDHGPCYRVVFRPTVPVFRLPRKLARLSFSVGQSWRHSHRMIVAVEPIEPRLSRCITVDSPSRLYLAGEGMTPTHNTKCGAEWLGRAVYEDPSGFPSAVVCPTLRDVKKVAFQGPAGLLNVIPPELVVDYNRSDFLITMKNIAGGVSQIQGFTSEQPESLRGPNHCRAWCDEIAAWENEEDTWDMLELTLRLGDNPQILWTSTPKPKDLIRRITEPKSGRIIVTGSTYENRANLAATYLEKITRFEGTRLGDQELHGKLLNLEDGGIVKRSQFRIWPHDKPLPAFEWIIVSLDTAFTEKTRAREGDTKTDTMKGDPDATACTVWGTFRNGKRAEVLLLDCWEDHLGLPELIRRTRKEMAQHYGDDGDRPMLRPLVGPDHSSSFGRKPDVLLIEDKGSGISLRQMLEREGIYAFPYNPGRADKLTRLHVVSPVFARRLVWLPESEHPERKGKPKTWVEPLLAQLCSFTGSGSIKHDDFVDACSQAFRFMVDKGFLDVSLPQREQREREVEARDRGFEREARRGGTVNPYSC